MTYEKNEYQDCDESSEAEQYLFEEAKHKKLDRIAKFMAHNIGNIYLLDWSLLESILIDNKSEFEQFKCFDKHIKYISRRGEKAAYMAVLRVGKFLDIENYFLLNHEPVYQDIITAYRFFGKEVLVTAIDHLLRSLTAIKNKITDSQHKEKLQSYITNARSKQHEIMKNIEDGFIVKAKNEVLNIISIPPEDQRKAECPNCLSTLSHVPDETKKCHVCRAYMYVTMTVKGEKQIVTKIEKQKIQNEWDLIRNMTYVEYSYWL